MKTRPDMATDADLRDDPWDRAHVIPDLDDGFGWPEWLAMALIVVALVAVGFIAGRLTAEAAERQVAVCMDGCK